jgi:cyclopropane fatty-acyl-phospholipid synthase-like methyltransferase
VDRAKFSAIALRHREVNNPLGLPSLDRIIACCELPPGARVLDVGCGKAAFLLRLAEQRAVRGDGVDVSEAALREARARSRTRTLRGSLTLRCVDARRLAPPSEPYDLVACLGASHAFGDLRATLATLRSWTRPKGWIVVGEGFWKRPPDPRYLDLLEATAEELVDDPGNVRTGEALGLTLVEHWASRDEEWDEFEAAYLEGVESYAREVPEDPDVPAMLERARRWHQGYLDWGRSTLGFGVYIFRNSLEHTSDGPRGPGGGRPSSRRSARLTAPSDATDRSRRTRGRSRARAPG